MPSSADRKRIEIPGTLYRELDRDARSLHISPTALATMLLSESLARHRELAYLPSRPLGGLCDQGGRHAWDGLGTEYCTCLKCGLTLAAAAAAGYGRNAGGGLDLE